MKKGFAALLCLTLIFSLLGCRKQMEEVDSTATQMVTDSLQTLSVGICLPNQTEEPWLSEGAALKKGLEALGYRVFLGEGKDAVQLQAEQITAMVTQGIDCLVVAAVDSAALTQCLAEAKKKDIPVVAYDRPLLYADSVAGFVGFDYEALGRKTAQKIVEAKALETAKAEGRSYTVEFLMGAYQNHSSVQYHQGVLQVLKKYLDDGVLVYPGGAANFEDVCVEKLEISLAEQRCENRLSTHYVDAWPEIVVAGDDLLADGWAKVLQAHSCPVENWPLITGQNVTRDSLARIAAGTQLLTAYCSRDKLVQAGVEAVQAALLGEPVGAHQSSNGIVDVPAALLLPKTVTADTYQQLVDTGIFIPVETEQT